MSVTSRALDMPARQARAERILDGAAELLLRLGYKRVTVDDVAAHVGIGKGTIYLHWPTREALFFDVLEREYLVVVEGMVDRMQADPRAALPRQLLGAYFAAAMDRPLVRAVMVADLEVLGKLAHGSDISLVSEREKAAEEYVAILAEYGLLRTDCTVDELTYILRATASGFFFTDLLLNHAGSIGVERQAELLGSVIELGIGSGRQASDQATAAIAEKAIALYAGLAETLRAQLRKAYE